MYKISNLLENIKKYGNCKVVFEYKENPSVKTILEFAIKNNHLVVYEQIETYDDNGELLSGHIPFVYYGDELEVPISRVVCGSFIDTGIVSIETNKEYLEKNSQGDIATNYATEELVCMVSSMLSLSLKDLTQWAVNGEVVAMNILASNKNIYSNLDDYQFEYAVEYIEMLAKKIEYYYNITKDTYEKLKSSDFEAQKRWQKYCKNKTPLR